MLQTPAWDLWLFEVFNHRWRTGDLDCFMPLVSEPAFLWAVFPFAAVWLWRKGGLRSAALLLVVLASLGLSDLGAQAIKQAAGRVRPLNALPGCFYQDDCQWLCRPADFQPDKTRGSSFVSAHASNTMAAAVSAKLVWRALWLWPLILPLLAGWSRVYLGKHYPSDVLAGWIFGALVALGVWWVWRWAVRRRGP